MLRVMSTSLQVLMFYHLFHPPTSQPAAAASRGQAEVEATKAVILTLCGRMRERRPAAWACLLQATVSYWPGGADTVTSAIDIMDGGTV